MELIGNPSQYVIVNRQLDINTLSRTVCFMFVLKGTLEYMSPEILTGDQVGRDARIDLSSKLNWSIMTYSAHSLINF